MTVVSPIVARGVDGWQCQEDSNRSADLPLNLRAGMWPTPPHAVAYLSEAVAPWRCSTYVRITVDQDTELSMPVDNAAPLLAALSELVASAMTEAEVSR